MGPPEDWWPVFKRRNTTVSLVKSHCYTQAYKPSLIAKNLWIKICLVESIHRYKISIAMVLNWGFIAPGSRNLIRKNVRYFYTLSNSSKKGIKKHADNLILYIFCAWTKKFCLKKESLSVSCHVYSITLCLYPTITYSLWKKKN